MDIKDTIFVIDRCTETLESFFPRILPGSIVEDGCALTFEGKEYSILPKTPVGTDVQRDIKFYILEEWFGNSIKDKDYVQ